MTTMTKEALKGTADSYPSSNGEVSLGDEVIYYNGSKAELDTSTVKRIYYSTSRWGYKSWRITLSNGSIISNPRVTMKRNT